MDKTCISNLKDNALANCFALTMLVCSLNVYALPALDQIESGTVNVDTISGANSSIQVTQNSDRAILNWHSFNIEPNESVNFNQPSNAICLNRINAVNGMSKVEGSLNASGKIILINSSGILFSETSRVNVAGIAAIAADVANADDLLESPLTFVSPQYSAGPIINRGTINVQDQGIAALLGGSVSNEGMINAKYSLVLLESGRAFTLDFNGDGVLNFCVACSFPLPTNIPALDDNGNVMSSAVNMSGQIINDYGDVVIMADAAPGIFDNLINMTGAISAKHVQQFKNGVLLLGDEHGNINVTGSIDASGAPGEQGGSIVIVGNTVNIDTQAVLDVSGIEGKGYIAIADATGKTKKFNESTRDYVGVYKSQGGANIYTPYTAVTIRLFNDYKRTVDYKPPVADISIVEDVLKDNLHEVNINFSYNSNNINLRSIKPEDYVAVQKYLNSQPLVRGKYAHKQIVSETVTKDRVKVLADRFNPAVTDGCFMHGGFIMTDSDTGAFLGMVNSGTAAAKGLTEMSYLSRPDAWSHKPDNLTVEYVLPEGDYLQKDYSGLATAAVSSLLQYTNELRNHEYTIKGEKIDAMRASAQIANFGSWKALAKAGFELDKVDINTYYGPELRYQLEYKF